jgi:rhamnosyl/mannosyltransferase
MVHKFSPVGHGGMERVIANILEALHDEVDFHVLACADTRETSPAFKDDVVVQECSSFGCLMSMPLAWEFVKVFKRIAGSFDIVHFNEPFPLASIAESLSSVRRRLVTYHSPIVGKGLARVIYRPLQSRFLDRSDMIVATSENMVACDPMLAARPDKVTVIPLGIADRPTELSDKAIAASTRLMEKAGKLRRFLAVGRSVPYKGFFVLLEALSLVNQGFLCLVGDGPLRDRLKAKAKDLGISDRVMFTGAVTDQELHGYYCASDVFVLSSISSAEAFGLVQIEAMAWGKPVINTNLCTGVPWVSLHNKTGLTVPPGDPKAMADAMRCLADSPDERERLGRNGRARFESEFQREIMAKRILQVYRQILATKPAY